MDTSSKSKEFECNMEELFDRFNLTLTEQDKLPIIVDIYNQVRDNLDIVILRKGLTTTIVKKYEEFCRNNDCRKYLRFFDATYKYMVKILAAQADTPTDTLVVAQTPTTTPMAAPVSATTSATENQSAQPDIVIIVVDYEAPRQCCII